MGKIKDITGEKFGRLTAIKKAYSKKLKNGTRIYWLCKCDCGKMVNVATCHLTTGHTKSCGCYNFDMLKENHTKHGMRRTKIYSIWSSMIGRCTNPSNPAYINYGGRGITVCDDWMQFEKFYADMYPSYKDGLTIDRKNNDEGYCKENCKWATSLEQSNNRRNNRYIEFNNEIHTLAEWCKIYGQGYKAVHARLHKGWDFKDAITTPIDHDYHNVW